MRGHLYAVGGDDLDVQIEATMQEARDLSVTILTQNLMLELHALNPMQCEAIARAQERRAGDLGDVYGRLAKLLEQKGGE